MHLQASISAATRLLGTVGLARTAGAQAWTKLIDYTVTDEQMELSTIKVAIPESFFKCRAFKIWLNIPYTAPVTADSVRLIVRIANESAGAYNCNLVYNIGNQARSDGNCFLFNLVGSICEENDSQYGIGCMFTSKMAAYEGANAQLSATTSIHRLKKQFLTSHPPYLWIVLSGQSFAAGTRIILEGSK